MARLTLNVCGNCAGTVRYVTPRDAFARPYWIHVENESTKCPGDNDCHVQVDGPSWHDYAEGD